MMIVLLCLLSLALAEPPVRDSYLDAAESLQDHGHHQQYTTDLTAPTARHQTSQHEPTSRFSQHGGSSFRRSQHSPTDFVDNLSQLHGVSKSSRISQEYRAPEFRDSVSQVYGATQSSRLSQEYGAPEFRSTLSQVYGAPQNSRLSQQYGAPDFRDNLSQEYGVPSQESFRSVSQEYGVPASQYDDTSFSPVPKSSVTHYGSPTSRSLQSSSYLPSQRSTHHAVSRPEELSRSYTRNSSPVQKYGVPKFQSRKSYTSESDGSSNPSLSARSNNYQAKESSLFGGRSVSTQYGVPEARNAFEPSGTYGALNTRRISQEYGLPSGRAIGAKTNSVSASYSTLKSPSEQYGVPQSRQVDSKLSNQYGVPSEDSDQGYQYARNALELLNQEPANYEFAYKVDDYESGSDFGHVETRQEDKAEGSYFVVLPDGTKQVVEYEADEEGFKPRISVQPADVTRSTGPY